MEEKHWRNWEVLIHIASPHFKEDPVPCPRRALRDRRSAVPVVRAVGGWVSFAEVWLGGGQGVSPCCGCLHPAPHGWGREVRP